MQDTPVTYKRQDLINISASRESLNPTSSNDLQGIISMSIYLYHKRHRDTKLNYFGKTIRDPYTYNGSGLYWQRHLKNHGINIETIQVWEFTDIEECKKFALEFSIKNNIVESTEWANLVLENGIDGQTPGFKNVKLSDYNKAHTGDKHRSKQPGFTPNRLGKTDSEETKIKKRGPRPNFQGFNNPLYGKKLSPDQCKKLKGPRPHTAGSNNPMYGKIVSNETRDKLKAQTTGKLWWHNNVTSTMALESPGPNWVRGRLPKSPTL